MARQHHLAELGIEDLTYTIEEWQEIEARTGEKFEYHEGRLVSWRLMAGGSVEHSIIGSNVLYVLGVAVRDLERVWRLNCWRGRANFVWDDDGSEGRCEHRTRIRRKSQTIPCRPQTQPKSPNTLLERRNAKEPLCNAHNSDLKIRIANTNRYLLPDGAVVCGEPTYDLTVSSAITNPIIVVEVLSPSSIRYDMGEKFDYYSRLPSLREYVLIAQDEYVLEVRSRTEPGGKWTQTFAKELSASVTLESLGVELPMAELYRSIGPGEDDAEQDDAEQDDAVPA